MTSTIPTDARAPEARASLSSAPGPHKPSDGRMLKQSAWVGGAFLAGQVLRFGSNLVVTRLLAPEAWGTMAIASSVIQGLLMFSDIGIGPSLIHNKRAEEEEFQNTAWTIQVARGVALWLIVCALARPMAIFYKVPTLTALLPAAGLTAVIAGLNATAAFMYKRRLEAGRIAVMDLLAQATGIGTTVALAWWTHSVWAMVAGSLATTATFALQSHFLPDGIRNRLRWAPKAAREIMHFGRWIFASTAVTFLGTYLDKLVLGALVTLGELGLYSFASMLAMVVTGLANQVTHSILFPLLARRQDDATAMVRACMRARRAILWAAGAMCSTMMIAAPALIKVFDARFSASGEMSQWLALVVWMTILSTSVDRAAQAVGDAKTLFQMNLIHAVGVGLSAALFGAFGLHGFILGMVGSRGLGHWRLVAGLPALRGQVMLQSVKATLALAAYATAAMLVVMAVKARAPGWETDAARLALGAAPMGVAAVVVLRSRRGEPGPRSAAGGRAPTISYELGAEAGAGGTE